MSSKCRWQHVVWHVWMTFFCQMSARHFRHVSDMSAYVGTTCHLGGLGDVMRRQHFQLRQELAECLTHRSVAGYCMGVTKGKNC